MNKRKGIIVLIIIGFLIILSCTLSNKKESVDEIDMMSGKINVEMKIKDYGIIKMELDADVAPLTVTNFIYLVNKKFYDGLTFHRIIKNFMIQGGDPNGNGYGGSGQKIKGEFTNNGVINNISHVRGTVSMARGKDDYNSASSQFFIVHKDSTHLDGDYAAFGHVTSGMEIVDKIVDDAIIQDINGTVLSEDQPIIEYIKVIG